MLYTRDDFEKILEFGGARILRTLRSLLNELARLRIVTTLKRVSSFNRDLRVMEIQSYKTHNSESINLLL